MDGLPPAPDSLGRLIDFTAEECRALAESLNGDATQVSGVLSAPIDALRLELDELERRILEATCAR